MDQKCILLIEDNPDDEELTLHALRDAGVSNPVVVARDGAEALDRLLGSRGWPGGGDAPGLPAVVLLDIKLPKVSGLDVLRQIRASPRTRLLPVVILTSSSEERDLVEGYSLGCNSYVRKPVDFGQFTRAVRQLGLYWLLLNEGPPAEGVT